MAVRMKPAIRRKIRPILIANSIYQEFNRAGDEAAYQFLIKQRRLKMLISNPMFRGMYITGLRSNSRYGNVGFTKKIARKSGHLGRLFYNRSATINVNRYGIKMGDTPSLFFIMNGNWRRPRKSSWGGKYCRLKSKIFAGCRGRSVAGYPGAGHVARHRRDYMKDFELRFKRIQNDYETITSR